MAEQSPPTELRIEANGLQHRVLSWAPQGRLPTDAPARTIVLVHGFMDAAGSWDLVAPSLADRGYRVLAPDMRGFGDTGRAPRGSYYHFADYIADLAGLTAALTPDEPFALVGHSMGGTITTLFAGTFPERVVRFANLEGVGPPDNSWEIGPIRMRRWLEQLADATQRTPRTEAVLAREEAFDRLAASHRGVPREVLRGRFEHLVHDVVSADGTRGVRWRFDPLHRTTSPNPFHAKNFIEFAKRVTCPVLFVSGGDTGFHVDDEDERLAAFANLRRAVLDRAGHMLHWTQPRELTALLLDFLGG